MQPVDIAVRAYVPTDDETTTFHLSEQFMLPEFGRVLVFDTETTIDRFQNLKFGSFKLYRYKKMVHEGVFYKPESISKSEHEELAAYCKQHGINLMNVQAFVRRVFLPEVCDLQTLCIGFNLPFDLSRIAIEFGYSRGRMKGGFSFNLTESNRYPRLTIKRIDGSKAFIRFTSSIDKHKRRRVTRGHFLDLHTLVHALTGESHSLESACQLFGAPVRKGKTKEHGKITAKYIDYNRRDVDATYSLYLKAKDEFNMYGLNDTLSVTQVYSPASIGKAYFKKMNIKPFHAKNSGYISNEMLGYVTNTYFGGRSEVKVRKQPTLVTLLDFLSMYPSVCILLNLWDFITCHHIDQQEYTEGAKNFVHSITVDDFQHKDTWSRLNAIVQVEPDGGDILPVRAKFDNKETYNIGDCYVSSAQSKKLWYALADVVNSKIRTGKTPRIIHAIRFIPVGKQRGLKPIILFGNKINPYKDNLFKAVIEQRKEVQQQQNVCQVEQEKEFLDKKQKALKLIANSASYGIFLEINTEEEEKEVTAYGLETIKCQVNKVETFGKQFNPFVATFITSGARLVLGIVEALLAKHGAVHAFCDTDSMAVPPQHAREIQEFFGALNPYSFDAPLFKVDEYEDEHGKKRPLESVWFYGISAKRYVLYKMDETTGKIEIVKASSHGLGHLLSPFGKGNDSDGGDKVDEKWRKQVWLDMLHLYYGLITPGELTAKYENAFALSKLAITKPHILKRFDRLNVGKPYDRQIKPFNFCVVGIGNFVDEETGKVVKPLSPYRRNSQQCPYDSFIDYESTKELQGSQYWKPFNDVLWQYVNHPEAKFDGDVGVLSRKHVTVNSVTHIGKESNNLEEAEILGVQKDDYVFYGSVVEQLLAHKEKISQAEPKDVKRYGISQQTLYNVKRAILNSNWNSISAKTIQRLLAYIYVNKSGTGKTVHRF